MMKGTNQPVNLAGEKDADSQRRGYTFNNAGSQRSLIQQDKDQIQAKQGMAEQHAGRYRSFRRQPAV